MEVTRVEVTRDHSKQFRWSAHAANGEPVANSGEGYEHREHAVESAHALYPTAEVHVSYTAYEDRAEPEVVDYVVDFSSDG